MTDPQLLYHWGLTCRRERQDLQISGSPNRTIARTLFEDGSGQVFILERYDLRKKAAQTAQNRILEYFHNCRLPGIYPALQTTAGEHGISMTGVSGKYARGWRLIPCPGKRWGTMKKLPFYGAIFC